MNHGLQALSMHGVCTCEHVLYFYQLVRLHKEEGYGVRVGVKVKGIEV